MSRVQKVAVVTGAGSGIGLGIAGALATVGYRVIGVDHDEEVRDCFAELIGDCGSTGALECVDLADGVAVRERFETIAATYDGIDALVNSVGVHGGAIGADASVSAWRQVVEADLTGAFLCCEAAAASMISRRVGSIVNVAPATNASCLSMRAAQTTARHGLVGLTRALAAEWGSSGVRVNALCSELSEVPLTEGAAQDALVGERVRALAPAVLFLLSEAARYINGMALPIGGDFAPADANQLHGVISMCPVPFFTARQN